MKMEMRSGDDSDLDDPEDLTMSHGMGNSGSNKFNAGFSPNRKFTALYSWKFHEFDFWLAAFTNPNTTITRVRQDAQKMLEAQNQNNAATGSAILDTYLQFITENTFGELRIL